MGPRRWPAHPASGNFPSTARRSQRAAGQGCQGRQSKLMVSGLEADGLPCSLSLRLTYTQASTTNIPLHLARGPPEPLLVYWDNESWYKRERLNQHIATRATPVPDPRRLGCERGGSQLISRNTCLRHAVAGRSRAVIASKPVSRSGMPVVDCLLTRLQTNRELVPAGPSCYSAPLPLFICSAYRIAADIGVFSRIDG